MIRAAIFDLDGTLADTIGDLGDAVNSVLSAHGFPEHSMLTYKVMVGNGFAMLMRRALPSSIASPEAGNEELFTTLLNEAVSEYTRRSLATTKPFPGIEELLATLSSGKVLCSVLSNKPDPMVKHIVASLFPQIPFLAVIGDRESAPRKPDPSSALEIARIAGIPTGQFAFIGDSGVDMRTGAASGMLPLGASWGYRSKAELVNGGAAGILDKPSDFLAYLE
ncbi:MAG TPA: HAD family hydrolase [Spirochaetaceae bacterium]|nr:HAD family hydrolase [Spirochaetaceae bacterium]